MSYILLLLLFGSSTIIFGDDETLSEIDRVKERLQKSAKQLSMMSFSEPPDPVSYINHDLIKNSPHKINVTNQLTQFIREWSPRLLALDPTCPYYFSKFNNMSIPDEDRNLLSYLQSIELNETLAHPFINILPQTYRNAVPLLSVFQCSEFVYSTPTSFFHNIELIVGPGKTELSLERQSNVFSQLYCSLYGWPHFILVDQTKQPTITYDAQTLLSQDNLADVEFFSTSLGPGTCLFVPPDWVTGVQLNNSISLVFTFNKIEKSITDDELLPCTKTGETTLESIDFDISDTFNVTEYGLIAYFYQYLNPPMFDQQYTSETFLDYIREDKNVTQLIMNWTPELIKLFKVKLFKKLDINNDKKFSVDDYFDIKESNLKQIQTSIYNILEKLRQTVLEQYNELSSTIAKMAQQFENIGLQENARENLESVIENLPDEVKQQLIEKNVKVKEFLDNAKHKRPKRPSTNKQQHVREDDTSILFDKKENDDVITIVDPDQEEEITAEPIINENQPQRTDL